MGRSAWRCGSCRRQTTKTAGTIFQGTRTPLTVWFAAAWYLTSQKNGISALGLQRVLGLGSYQTAWAMLHRFRTAIVRPGRELLRGDVEVDETFIGGVKPGKRGRGAAGKVLVAIAVEQKQPKGHGRARIAVIPNAQAPTLAAFLLENVEPGSVIISDGLKSYPIAVGTNYTHKAFNVAASEQSAICRFPGCIASPRSSSPGCSVPTRAQSKPITSKRTSMSSASGSIGVARDRGACCSFG